MAEAFASAYLAGSVVAYSAGVDVAPVDPLLATVMRQHGIDISAHISQRLSDLPNVAFDIVVTLDDAVRHVAASIANVHLTIHHHYADPRVAMIDATSEERQRAYAMLALSIKDMVMDLPRYLAALPTDVSI